jgi:polygalacturonase
MRKPFVHLIFAGLTFWIACASAWAQANLPADFTVDKPTIPDRSFKITDYGAIADGKTLNSAAIQKTIDAAAAAGGGTVVIPAGRFFTAAFTLASNLNLHLDEGADLVMSDKPSDYKIVRGAFENCISAADCHDLEITGTGTIDGQGEYFWRNFTAPKDAEGMEERTGMTRRGHLVNLSHCTRVLVQEVLLENSPSFQLVPSQCQDVTIDRVRIKAPPSPQSHNTDGIDPSGFNFLITHCNIDTGDDNIAVKAGGQLDPSRDSCENFLITDCTFGHGHGMSVGSESYGGLRNMVVRNCTFNDTDAGIRLKSPRGRGGVLEDVTYENLTMTNVKNAILITSYYPKIPKQPDKDPMRPAGARTPVWRHILIRNVVATGCQNAGEIVGLPEMPAQDIVFDHVQISATAPIQIFNARGIQFIDSIIAASNGKPIIANAEVEGLQ